MAVKAKPKSNRAKFTIEKKTEKPKAKVEAPAPKKEKKIEVVAEEPQTEVEQKSPELTPIAAEQEQHQEVTSPIIAHQPEPEQPAPEEESQTQAPDLLPQNPFSVTMPTAPEHPAGTVHDNPFSPSNTMANDEHVTPQPFEQPAQSIPQSSAENAELSSTLPKEDPMPHQSSFSTPVELETNHKGKGIIIYFIIVAFIAFLVGIGSMALITFGLKKTSSGLPHVSLFHFMAKATPTPVKTAKVATPTPVPTKAVDLSAYNIKILNGSGITGAASKLKTELTTDGFTVVSTGNADNNNYTDTTIAIKKSTNPDYINKLKAVLQKEYSLAQSTDLSDADAKTEDILITIGSSTAK